jgi:hypothetical protein
VVPHLAIPFGLLAVVAAAALSVANIAALASSRVTRRLQPAITLRSE